MHIQFNTGLYLRRSLGGKIETLLWEGGGNFLMVIFNYRIARK